MKKKPEDIRELERRINEIQAKENLARRDKPESEYAHASKAGFRVGSELLSGVLVGAGVGYLLDSVTGLRPWLMVVFLFLGGAAGVLNVYRFVKGEEFRNKE